MGTPSGVAIPACCPSETQSRVHVPVHRDVDEYYAAHASDSGAALITLGASDSSRVLITVFGALNTIIAGLIAFLKSRRQPVRARMSRDDLERVVDEIENSAVMWHGISCGAHGYDAIDTNDEVTVRSEVACVTRLFDRAVKSSTANDPDNYAAGVPNDLYSAALRTRQPGQQPHAAAPKTQTPVIDTPAAPIQTPGPPPAAADLDESPATKAPEPAKPKEAEFLKTDKPESSDPAGDSANPAATADAPPVEAEPSASDAAKPIDSKVSLPESSASAKLDEENKAESSTSQATAGGSEEEPASTVTTEKHSEDTSMSVKGRK